MNTEFKFNKRSAYKTVCAMLAVLLLLASTPLLQSRHASAAQFAQRSITLSDSGPSANATITSGVGSGLAVKYRVAFTAATPAASMIIDFCSNNPIIGDNCTAPTGMSVSTPTLNPSQSGTSGLAGAIYGSNGWSVSAPNATQLKLVNDGNSAHDIAAGQQVFEISGITNPSTVGTFYARMYSYASNNPSSYSTPNSVGTIVDYGGVALSVTNIVTITARVQETLTFCLTKAPHTSWTTTHGCDDSVVSNPLNYPALTLGHGNAGATPTLDTSQIDAKAVYSQLSTNANNGAVINMRNSNTTCGGLSADAGATCAIPAVTGTTSTPYTAGPMAAGTAAFGLFVNPGAPDPGSGGGTGILPGTGATTPTPAYYNAAHATCTESNPTPCWFGMDNQTTEGAGLNPATLNGSVKGPGFYGSTLASTPGPVSRVNNMYIFAAAASLTTPAGIYTANMSLVATGTF